MFRKVLILFSLVLTSGMLFYDSAHTHTPDAQMPMVDTTTEKQASITITTAVDPDLA